MKFPHNMNTSLKKLLNLIDQGCVTNMYIPTFKQMKNYCDFKLKYKIK